MARGEMQLYFQANTERDVAVPLTAFDTVREKLWDIMANISIQFFLHSLGCKFYSRLRRNAWEFVTAWRRAEDVARL